MPYTTSQHDILPNLLQALNITDRIEHLQKRVSDIKLLILKVPEIAFKKNPAIREFEFKFIELQDLHFPSWIHIRRANFEIDYVILFQLLLLQIRIINFNELLKFLGDIMGPNRYRYALLIQRITYFKKS
jgi:hypothetical protein